jgi:hypothetical protein
MILIECAVLGVCGQWSIKVLIIFPFAFGIYLGFGPMSLIGKLHDVAVLIAGTNYFARAGFFSCG